MTGMLKIHLANGKIVLGRLSAFLLLCTVGILPAFLSPADMNGASVNGSVVPGYASVSAHWSVLVWPVGIILAKCVVSWPPREDSSIDYVGLRYRLCAAMIDFSVVMAFMLPLATLPLVFLEWAYTGQFLWAFTRDFSRPTDIVLLLMIFATFAAMWRYQYQAIRAGEQTIGQYIMGFRTVPEPGNEASSAGQHLILATISGGFWPINILIALSDLEHRFWWSKAAKTRNVFVFRK